MATSMLVPGFRKHSDEDRVMQVLKTHSVFYQCVNMHIMKLVIEAEQMVLSSWLDSIR